MTMEYIYYTRSHLWHEFDTHDFGAIYSYKIETLELYNYIPTLDIWYAFILLFLYYDSTPIFPQYSTCQIKYIPNFIL